MTEKALPACPVETTLTLISDKWKVLILRDLLPGTRRFGELKRSLGNRTQKGEQSDRGTGNISHFPCYTEPPFSIKGTGVLP